MNKPFDPDLTLDEINAVLSPFVVHDILGGGGQGSVFKGRDMRTDIEVALKIYSPNQLIKRAELEVKKLEQVSSPYLAEVIEHGNVKLRDLDCYFVATKYMKGQDLKELLNIRKMEAFEVKALLINILSAINELWKLRVVHSDIKPANILYLENGDFVLIDLGFAKHLGDESITLGPSIFGTLGYIAPEQLKGRRNLTLRADMFSLGVLGYECLTGLHPFHRNQNLIFNHMNIRHLSEIIDGCENLIRSIHWLMEFNPLKRPNSCKQVINLLNEGE